jgi:two-component sensor histidine kinase
VTQSNSKVSISVRDQGIGLPPDFEATSQKGLGMRLVNAFTAQLGGNLEIRRHSPGVEFILVFPKPSVASLG